MSAIFEALLPILLKLLIQMGMAWLAKKFPWLTPAQLQVLAQHHDEVVKSKQRACQGLFCAPELKENDG